MLCVSACAPAATETPRPVQLYGYEVVREYPHDASAWTQGLAFHHGALIESTGIVGESSLRRVALETGAVERRFDVPPPHFAEGVAVLGHRAIQLTWDSGRGFIYDALTLRPLGEFPFTGEGWGVATDGERLVASNGTDELRFFHPDRFATIRTVRVRDGAHAVTRLNELEVVRGAIFANIWQEQRIARIDPKSGRVTGWIDLGGLGGGSVGPANELNGIAYDATGDRLFVTGKRWTKVFEIRLVPR